MKQYNAKEHYPFDKEYQIQPRSLPTPMYDWDDIHHNPRVETKYYSNYMLYI